MNSIINTKIEGVYATKRYTVTTELNHIIVAYRIHLQFGSKYIAKNCRIFYRYKDISIIRTVQIHGIALLYKDVNKSFNDNLSSIPNIYRNICEDNYFKKSMYILLFRINKKYSIAKRVGDITIASSNKQVQIHHNQKFSIKITIKNNKKEKSLHIHQNNLDKIGPILIKNLFTDDRKVYMDINWSYQNKKYEQLLQDIAFYVLTKFDGGISGIILFRNGKMKNYILNIANIIKVLFKNERIIIHILKYPSLWKFLFDSLGLLMSSKFIMETKWIQLIQSFLITLPYWRLEHVLYAYRSGFLKYLSYAMTVYYHRNISRKSVIKKFVGNIIIRFDTINRANHHFEDNFFLNRLILDHLDKKEYQFRKRKKKINYQNYKHHVNHLTTYVPKILQKKIDSIKQLYFMTNPKNEMIKICGNSKCIKTKRNEKSRKFKICSRCKVIYYCCRRCQKYDWNYNHRLKCMILMSQLLL